LDNKQEIISLLIRYVKLGLEEVVVLSNQSPILTAKYFAYLRCIVPKEIENVELLLELFNICSSIGPEIFLRLCQHANVKPDFISVNFVVSLFKERKFHSIPLACQLCPESIPEVINMIVEELVITGISLKMVAIYNTDDSECYESPLSATTTTAKKEDWEINLKKKRTVAEESLIKIRLSEEHQVRKSITLVYNKVSASIQLLHSLIKKAQTFPIEFTPLLQMAGLIINSLLAILEHEQICSFSLFSSQIDPILESVGRWSMEDDYNEVVLHGIYQARNIKIFTRKIYVDGKVYTEISYQ
jgi:hypothetical protein